MIPFYLLNIDHASYSRFEKQPVGGWDVWLNVINVEADHGASEAALFSAFYGETPDRDIGRWREMAVFSSCVLQPLEWAGLLIHTEDKAEGRNNRHWFKTPLWRTALKLDTDEMLAPIQVQ